MNFPGTEFLKTTGKFKWTNNCRRVYTFSMKDKTLVNEISRRSRAIGSPLGRVSRTPSLHISDSGSGRRKHKKISRSRFTLEKNFESTRGHVYPLKSLFTCYNVCHVRKKLQYQNENLLAKRVTYLFCGIKQVA